jgi:hypothetical protein
VVIDTMSRAVEGAENESDTVRAFYAHTGRALKAAGVAVVRLDHSGKDMSKGQRGSSAKTDDVDVVYRLTARENGVRIDTTHKRSRWVRDRIDLTITSDPLAYTTGPAAWPAGTKEVADLLDGLGVPMEAKSSAARLALKGAGQGRRADVVNAALRWRRTVADGEMFEAQSAAA